MEYSYLLWNCRHETASAIFEFARDRVYAMRKIRSLTDT